MTKEVEQILEMLKGKRSIHIDKALESNAYTTRITNEAKADIITKLIKEIENEHRQDS